MTRPVQFRHSVARGLQLAVLVWGSALTAVAAESRWWKGNLHTHSLWSDGDDYPESIAAWYKEQGYHFLALSDHNVMLEGERWLSVTPARGGGPALERNRVRFGEEWLQHRVSQGTNQVRLKTLAEFRGLLEEPGRFLLVPSEEITGNHLASPVHVNATNLRERIAPVSGTNVLDIMQQVVNAVLEQRRRTGQPMFPHINHPNFGWGITAEELMQVRGEQFFEVYNGHPAVHNEGDSTHAGMERAWDIMLTWRLARLQLPPVFGLAVDDGHNYHTNSVSLSNPGRGWVMVRAGRLDPPSIIAALEAGDFYSTSGVTLRDVRRSGDGLRIEIEPEDGVTYRTRFIGTRRTFNDTRTPLVNAAGEKLRVTQRYHGDVGEVLAEVEGPVATYRIRGDELYVRATVSSSRRISNPSRPDETAAAWIQPVLP